MSLRPSIGLVYGVRVSSADVDRVRALCDAGALPGCEVWDGGELRLPHAIVGATASWRPLLSYGGEVADGLPLDVRQIDGPISAGVVYTTSTMYQRLGPAVVRSAPTWWIVARVS